jgi:hypothetical protein
LSAGSAVYDRAIFAIEPSVKRAVIDRAYSRKRPLSPFGKAFHP